MHSRGAPERHSGLRNRRRGTGPCCPRSLIRRFGCCACDDDHRPLSGRGEQERPRICSRRASRQTARWSRGSLQGPHASSPVFSPPLHDRRGYGWALGQFRSSGRGRGSYHAVSPGGGRRGAGAGAGGEEAPNGAAGAQACSVGAGLLSQRSHPALSLLFFFLLFLFCFFCCDGGWGRGRVSLTPPRPLL